MKIAVKDANVLIDLDLSGTAGLWFRLKIETHTTEMVLNQVRKGGHQNVLAYADTGKIQVHSTSADILFECAEWVQDKPDLEIQDASVFLLARRIRAVLMTGDQDLRTYSEIEQIEVHGTLWIFDQLVEKKLLNPADAAKRLQKLLTQGRRLPKDECQHRIALWRQHP